MNDEEVLGIKLKLALHISDRYGEWVLPKASEEKYKSFIEFKLVSENLPNVHVEDIYSDSLKITNSRLDSGWRWKLCGEKFNWVQDAKL